MIASFYEDATPEQQALLSIAEQPMRKLLAESPPDFWQVVVGFMGPEAVLTWAKELAEEERQRLEVLAAESQVAVDEVSAVLATAVVATVDVAAEATAER